MSKYVESAMPKDYIELYIELVKVEVALYRKIEKVRFSH